MVLPNWPAGPPLAATESDLPRLHGVVAREAATATPTAAAAGRRRRYTRAPLASLQFHNAIDFHAEKKQIPLALGRLDAPLFLLELIGIQSVVGRRDGCGCVVAVATGGERLQLPEFEHAPLLSRGDPVEAPFPAKGFEHFGARPLCEGGEDRGEHQGGRRRANGVQRGGMRGGAAHRLFAVGHARCGARAAAALSSKRTSAILTATRLLKQFRPSPIAPHAEDIVIVGGWLLHFEGSVVRIKGGDFGGPVVMQPQWREETMPQRHGK